MGFASKRENERDKFYGGGGHEETQPVLNVEPERWRPYKNDNHPLWRELGKIMTREDEVKADIQETMNSYLKLSAEFLHDERAFQDANDAYLASINEFTNLARQSRQIGRRPGLPIYDSK